MKGFTLLETLLVLALVALMAVAGIAAYQQRIVNFKVEKTALQMQALLEAAQNYNVNYSAWPSDSTALDPYLGPGVLNNCPWSYSTATCYSFVPQTSSASFGVSITVPSTQPNATQIAQMIATRLPNASASGAVVTARVTALVLPQQQAGLVTSIHEFTMTGSSVTINGLNACASGSHKLFLSLSGYAAPGYSQDGAGASSGMYSVVSGDPCDTYRAPGFVFTNPLTLTGSATAATVYICTGRIGSPNVIPATNATGVAIETCGSSSETRNQLNNKNKNIAPILY